jgi:hypothetical protein
MSGEAENIKRGSATSLVAFDYPVSMTVGLIDDDFAIPNGKHC